MLCLQISDTCLSTVLYIYRWHFVFVQLTVQLDISKYCLLLVSTYASARWEGFFLWCSRVIASNYRCSDTVASTYLLLKVGSNKHLWCYSGLVVCFLLYVISCCTSPFFSRCVFFSFSSVVFLCGDCFPVVVFAGLCPTAWSCSSRYRGNVRGRLYSNLRSQGQVFHHFPQLQCN